jgi:uncharacterized protein (DUF983 family)
VSRERTSWLHAGLRSRCSNCGTGPLFKASLTGWRRCDVCGADLSGQDSGDGPVAFIVLIVGFIAVFDALFAEVAWQWPIWLPLTVILVLLIMRPAKPLMIALQYRHRRDDFGQSA